MLKSQQKIKIRWGIIGLGNIAHKFAKDLLTVHDAQLYAVASRTQENAIAFASKFNAEKAPEPVRLYPHARKVGNLLFLSGVGPRERNTKKIPGVELNEKGEIHSYDIADQCHSVFKNVRTILEASGSSWESLVDVTVFLTNMKDDFKTFNEIYAEYFKDVQPCRTTVEA